MHLKCFCWAKNICKLFWVLVLRFRSRRHLKKVEFHQHFIAILSFSHFSSPPSRTCWSLCVGNKFSLVSTDQLLFHSIWHNSWNSFVVGLRSLCLLQRADFSGSCRICRFVSEKKERRWKKKIFLIRLWKKVIKDDKSLTKIKRTEVDVESRLINVREIQDEKLWIETQQKKDWDSSKC